MLGSSSTDHGDDPDPARDQRHHLRHHPVAAGRLSDDDDRGACRPGRGRRPEQARSSCGRPTASTSRSSSSISSGLGGLLHGDYGYSFEYNRPVADVVGDRMLLTIVVSFATIIFIWVVSFPIGDLFGDAPVQPGRLWADVPRLPRPGDAQLPAGAGAALFRQCDVRHLDRRADGPGLSGRAVELGQSSSRCWSISGFR